MDDGWSLCGVWVSCTSRTVGAPIGTVGVVDAIRGVGAAVLTVGIGRRIRSVEIGTQLSQVVLGVEGC